MLAPAAFSAGMHRPAGQQAIRQAHSDGNASSRGPLPSTDHGAVSTAAAHENQRGPGSVASIPALCNDPLPGTEEPEDNRRSKLPSGGARAWSTDFDARNIGDGDRTSESPSPPMAVLIAAGAACVCVVNQTSMSFSVAGLGWKRGPEILLRRASPGQAALGRVASSTLIAHTDTRRAKTT